MNASKTVAVPVDRLYEAFADPALRERWLPGTSVEVRSAITYATAINVVAIVPVLLTNAVWGAVAGLLALGLRWMRSAGPR